MEVEGDGDVINASWYCGIVRSLLYLSTFTRRDVSFSVNYYSRFLEMPLSSYRKGIICVLPYVATTKDLCLGFCRSQKCEGSPYAFKIYSDAYLGGPYIMDPSVSFVADKSVTGVLCTFAAVLCRSDKRNSTVLIRARQNPEWSRYLQQSLIGYCCITCSN
jgi:hypothetical protein